MPPVGTRNKQQNGDTAVADAPDNVRGEEEEVSLEDQLAGDLKDEGIRVLDEAGKQVKDGIEYLLSKRNAAIVAAKAARSAGVTFEKRTGALALSMLEVRASIWRAETGKPDWGGSTQTYKDTVAEVVSAAMIPGETRATVANRLQRRCTRMLGQFIAERINESRKLGLDEDDLSGALSAPEKALQSEDENIQKLVAAVNEEYRVGDHAENEPYSPFEPSKTAQRTPATRDEQRAGEVARSLSQIRQNIALISLDVVTAELVGIAQAVTTAALGNEAKFGKGRATVTRNAEAAAVILHSLAKTLAEQDLTKEERTSFEKAMALTA